MSSTIPAPEYVSETVPGSVFKLQDAITLVIGDIPSTLAHESSILSGDLVIRYGLTLLIPTGKIFIPGLFAAEKGGMLVGREAWDFMQSNFALHPRADVVGLGIDGKTVQALIREVDFGVPVKVFAYANLDAATPTTELTHLIIGDNAPPLPDLLAHYLAG